MVARLIDVVFEGRVVAVKDTPPAYAGWTEADFAWGESNCVAWDELDRLAWDAEPEGRQTYDEGRPDQVDVEPGHYPPTA